MKKIVINSCFGGFSLSASGVKRYAELLGKKCYFFTTDFKDGEDKYTPATVEDCDDKMFWSAYSIPNPGEILKQDENWHSLSKQEQDNYNKLYLDIYITNRPDSREDPLLIQVVEELGSAANGSCASLKIVEIPDDMEYEIAEYDGNEHVAERHRTWY